MKPFKQGIFSRYCSVYSTLNSLQSLGIKLKYQQWQIADKKAVHLRIRSSLIDHYTVIKRITKDRICFYDSSDLPDISLKYVSTNDSKKYQICFRQVYFLSLEAV